LEQAKDKSNLERKRALTKIKFMVGQVPPL